jgi:DNA-binding response OmpR family regulator
MRILVVEDESRIAHYLSTGLEQEGHVVHVESNGVTALQQARSVDFDLILLDWMLPDMDGLALCRQLRSEGGKTPIVMLTARDATSDKIAGLDSGADDYLTKPFEFDELLARMRAVLRRDEAGSPPKLQVADLELDPGTHYVSRAGQQIVLTAKEFALLEYLMRRAGQVLTREELLSHVWGIDHNPGTNVVDVYVGYLRRKIDRGFAEPLLITLVNVGYKLGHPA